MPREPLTTPLVAELMQKLLTAFPSRNVAGQNLAHTAEIYRDGLKGLSGDALRAAVDRAIQEDTYFPKVARLRELAAAWERHNRVEMPTPADTDPLWCGVCRQHATYKPLWRPRADAYTRALLSHDGKYVLLESTERLKCACATPSKFVPAPGTNPPAAKLDALPIPAQRTAVRSDITVSVESGHAA